MLLRLVYACWRWLSSTRSGDRALRKAAGERETGSFSGPAARRARSFEDDYRAATRLLRDRMDRRYPDNYHARLSAVGDRPYDHGAKRAEAVDAASTAIAMALREGATVEQAAEAGAVSVGI